MQRECQTRSNHWSRNQHSRAPSGSFLQLARESRAGGGRRIGYESCKRSDDLAVVELAAAVIGAGRSARRTGRLLKTSQRGGRQAILAVVSRAKRSRTFGGLAIAEQAQCLAHRMVPKMGASMAVAAAAVCVGRADFAGVSRCSVVLRRAKCNGRPCKC